MMQQSLQKQLNLAYANYPLSETPACTDWVQRQYGQCVQMVAQVAWTTEMEQAIAAHGTKALAK